MNWKKWTAIGIAVAIVITGIVLHLVQPTISFAWTELMCTGTFIGGGIAGYLFGKNNPVVEPKEEKQILND